MCLLATLGTAVIGCSDDEPSAATDEPSAQVAAGVTSDAPEESPSSTLGSTIDPLTSSAATAVEQPPAGVDTSPPVSLVVPPTSPAATAVEQPPVGVDTLPPVSLADPAEVESGLEFTVDAVRPVDVEVDETGGDVAGPAVAVDIDVVNNGDDDVDLGRFVVSAEAAGAALSPIPGLFNEPFFGFLAPGERASATYGFRTGGASPTVLRLEDGLSRSIIVVGL